MEIIIKKEKDDKVYPINNVKDWKTYAPPQNPNTQWVEGKSAKTLAEYVFKDDKKDFEQKIGGLLSSLSLAIPQTFTCEPEAKTYFPSNWGTSGPRSHDLLMVGKADILIGIEAKVDEPFGEKLSTMRKTAEKKNADGGKNMNLRIDSILNFLYPKGAPTNSEDLMYQLLSATAGTIIEAKRQGKKNAVALFMVFKTKGIQQNRIEDNNSKFEVFCKSLGLSLEGGAIAIDGVKCWIKKVNIDLVK